MDMCPLENNKTRMSHPNEKKKKKQKKTEKI